MQQRVEVVKAEEIEVSVAGAVAVVDIHNGSQGHLQRAVSWELRVSQALPSLRKGVCRHG